MGLGVHFHRKLAHTKYIDVQTSASHLSHYTNNYTNVYEQEVWKERDTNNRVYFMRRENCESTFTLSRKVIECQ